MGFEVGFVPYNPDGWGPLDAAAAPPSLGGGSASVPFAPFSLTPYSPQSPRVGSPD